MTAFSRLLLFLVIFLPLAFAGAAYINGEDPIQQAKKFMGIGGDAPAKSVTATTSERNSAENRDMELRVLQLERDLAIAEEKLARCQLEREQNQ